MNTHIVTRALPGPNGLIPIGTEINADDFRKVDLLIAQRYLKPLQPAIEAEFEQRVLAVITKHLGEGGELAHLSHAPVARGRKPGSKNKVKENSPTQ